MKKINFVIMLIVAVITEIPCQAQGKVIYGCYGEKSGDLRIIGNLNECKKNEVPIYWNQEPTILNASNLKVALSLLKGFPGHIVGSLV